jgi:hypothetical protein
VPEAKASQKLVDTYALPMSVVILLVVPELAATLTFKSEIAANKYGTNDHD